MAAELGFCVSSASGQELLRLRVRDRKLQRNCHSLQRLDCCRWGGAAASVKVGTVGTDDFPTPASVLWTVWLQPGRLH